METKIKYVIGLGNIGKKYDKTIHNIGKEFVEYIKNTTDSTDWVEKENYNESEVDDIKLITSNTYMNNSVDALKNIKNFDLKCALICHDDVDLQVGTFKFVYDRGAAGHKGVLSISNLFGKSFARLRIGVGKSGDTKSFVLSEINDEDYKKITDNFETLKKAVLETASIDGMEKTMNVYNRAGKDYSSSEDGSDS